MKGGTISSIGNLAKGRWSTELFKNELSGSYLHFGNAEEYLMGSEGENKNKGNTRRRKSK